MEKIEEKNIETKASEMWQKGSYKNDERGETIYVIGAKYGYGTRNDEVVAIIEKSIDPNCTIEWISAMQYILNKMKK